MNSFCLFCNFVYGQLPCHRIWEGEKHLAFLQIFPKTDGFSVVIPKEHFPSYAFEAPDTVLQGLILAVKRIGRLIDSALDDLGRTGLILKGIGVDHLHTKLFPMHRTRISGQKPVQSKVDMYFKYCEGYISSHDHSRAGDVALAKLAEKICAA